jgi:KTSC domain
MQRTPIDSKAITSLGYDPATQLLEVEFKNGGIYRYENVTPEQHRALVAADSPGKYLRAHIIPTCAFTKVEPEAQPAA